VPSNTSLAPNAATASGARSKARVNSRNADGRR